MKLVGLSTDAVGKQQSIALKPGNLLRRIFETNSGSRHWGK